MESVNWLCCAVGQCFNLRFMYLILMYIDISFDMFTLIDGKGIPVLYCVCVYIYICGNTCVIVTGSCLVVCVQ